MKGIGPLTPDALVMKFLRTAFALAPLCLVACENSIDAGESRAPGADASSNPIACGGGSPCPDGYDCFGGLCALHSDVTGCDPMQTIVGDDGCGPEAVCFEDLDDQTRCYGLPPCPEGEPCPIGPIGSVCNEGYLPSKHRICLVSQCVDESSCPAGWACLRGPGAPVLGQCSDGSVGTVCYEPAHCVSQRCAQGLPGLPGVCW